MPPRCEKYTATFIINYCLENDIILTKDISNEQTDSKSVLEGKCKTGNCLNEWKKTMKNFYGHGGAYCKTCAKENGKIKVKETWLNNYGKEHPLQTKECMEKQKQTFLERYDVEHALQNPDIMKRRDNTMIDRWGAKHAVHNDKLNQKIKDTNMERRGVENPFLSEDVKELIRQRCLNKHGVEHYWQSEEFREKVKKTLMEKYSVENPSQIEDVKEQKRQTCLENHSVEHPWQSENIREKVKKTMMDRHGVEYAMQSEHIREKCQQTCNDKYGARNPMQNAEVLERNQKAQYRRKLYITPSGEEWSLQGYEPLVAPRLIEQYQEENITSDIKIVPAVPWTDSIGKTHVYRCDFYVESLKLIIEVKSTWTVQQGADKIQRTRKASNELGYDFRLIVLNKAGEWIEDITTSSQHPPYSTSSP